LEFKCIIPSERRGLVLVKFRCGGLTSVGKLGSKFRQVSVKGMKNGLFDSTLENGWQCGLEVVGEEIGAFLRCGIFGSDKQKRSAKKSMVSFHLAVDFVEGERLLQKSGDNLVFICPLSILKIN
jgi:hypothetical protein